MSEEPNARERLATVEGKLDQLAHSVDERFNAVDSAFVEQREYTEFAFERLQGDMQAGFGEVSRRFDGVSERFDGMASRFDRLERKLDQFIDTQSRTNALVERRLNARKKR
jgi:hypothetical protein